jgi:hypothetical protein
VAGIDKGQVLVELTPEWLAGLDGAQFDEGQRLLGEVVDDWALEADSTPDPGAVLAIQRKELAARGTGQDADGRLHVLRSRVVERKVDRLSAATYALGKAILDGSANDDEARAQGKAYLADAEEIAAELDSLGVASGAPVRRELGDAVMDALYAVERKAMSIRLARDGHGAPSITP